MSGKKDAVKLNVEIYDKIVNEIKSTNEKVIRDNFTPTVAGPEIKTNNVIPDFITADEEMVKMLKALKQQVFQITTTMENVRASYVDIDADAIKNSAKLETH
jgi:hypothetical protein